MANFTFKDIDFSMEKNSTSDVPIITDADSIKRTLYNNLMISAEERYFDSSARLDIRDLINEENNFLVRKQIRDAIVEAIVYDPRIKDLRNLEITFNDDSYNLNIVAVFSLNVLLNGDNEISLSLVFKRE